VEEVTVDYQKLFSSSDRSTVDFVE
jgi:hypothetical protein